MSKFKLSLKFKYPLYTFLLTLIIAIITVVINSKFFYTILMKNFKNEVNSFYNIIKPELLLKLNNYDYLKFNQKIDYLISVKEVNGIEIIDSNENVLLKRGICKGLKVEKSFSSGKLVVYFSKVYINNLINELKYKIFIFFIILLPVIAFVSYFISKNLSEDINKISEMIEKLGDADFEEINNISIKRKDELYRLLSMLRFRHFQLIKNRQQISFLINAIEQSYNSIIITDLNGNIIYVNPSFERITGYSKEEVIGKNPNVLKSGKQTEEFYKDLWNTILNGKIWEGVLINKNKAGNLYYEKMTITPIKNIKGEIEYFMAIKQDITKEIEYQKRILRLEKMKTVEIMASGVAHEINNVLTTVVGYPDILSLSCNDEKIINGLKKIKEAGLKISNILEELTVTTKIISLPKQLLDVNQIIHEVLNSNELNELLKDKYIKIELNLNENIKLINMSKQHIFKSILNLIKNSIEAIEREGKIIISTENVLINDELTYKFDISPGEYVKIEIIDTGKGIPQKDLDKIFEPFYTKKVLGRRKTGVGLTIVWNTIQLYNGAVNVNSDEKGTKFELYFHAHLEKKAIKEEKLKLKDFDNTKYSILIVDDDASQREITAEILRKNNFKVFSVDSGEKAIEFVKKRKVDLILLDMVMEPGMDGCETFENILKINPHQKAIIVSGMSYSDRINRAIELGVKHYLKKPFTSKKLIETIKITLLE